MIDFIPFLFGYQLANEVIIKELFKIGDLGIVRVKKLTGGDKGLEV